ncbi:Chitin deacetylase [Lachnellula hyalina]|uniref:Chitin deacetylase n=1 Tax=Lachnellula hyalina TaxID=1316788 RepID=A0A8H8R0V7_9HELO|nr:Chitin deacetylase [Lachnellula hyalina]TVY26403.1 Chitin deacetylase [Lachnellula hyalina]
MWPNFIAAALALFFGGLSYAFPAEPEMGLYNLLPGRANDNVSPDNACGNVVAGANNGYFCEATKDDGGCCSQYGYCGSSTDYCLTGCQPNFGTCSTPPSQPIEDNFLCGPQNQGELCSDSLCCSQNGYCGSTDDYCGGGCQPAYGQCKTDLTPPTGNDKCGPQNQGATCSGNQCCSVEGNCGTTSDYCADPRNCLLGYGRCDSDTTPAGPSTVNVARPLKGPVPYTDDIDDCIQDNVVALSFDDGPSIYTSRILDILKAYGYHATFFISGNNNGRGAIDTTSPYPDLTRRMVAEGHQVASHTWSHYSLLNVTHDLRISQMVKNEMAFNNIIGMWPTYMRPPYSDCTKESGCCDDMLALGYHRVYFDLDTEDYLHPLPSQIQRSKNIVKKALADKTATDYLSIQHDIVEQSVTNLSAYYFNVINARGWRGVTVGECLGDTDTSNWYRSFNN